jgi:hypothetical protein
MGFHQVSDQVQAARVLDQARPLPYEHVLARIRLYDGDPADDFYVVAFWAGRWRTGLPGAQRVFAENHDGWSVIRWAELPKI